MKTQKILSLILAMALVFSIGCVSVFAADAPMVFDDVEETITLPDTFEADGEDGAIRAENGAKLTINGTGTVKALHVKDFTMAVWAKDAGTEVIINGGHYENEGDPNKLDQADLIYASLDASIVINGGTFKCATPRWTLNCNNTTGGTITVKGGKFYGFNPAEADTDGDNEIIVPAGYEVVEVVEADGTWYEVVESKEVSIVHDSTQTLVDAEGNGAIRFVFNVNIPKATKTYFGAYMLPLNIFEASGVANAVQVQYDTEIETSSSFAADLVKIPADCLTTSIYAIPYIRTADGVVTFTGASASVQ